MQIESSFYQQHEIFKCYFNKLILCRENVMWRPVSCSMYRVCFSVTSYKNVLSLMLILDIPEDALNDESPDEEKENPDHRISSKSSKSANHI